MTEPREVDVTDGEGHDMANSDSGGGHAEPASTAAGMMSKMSPAETLVFLGAIVVLGGWVLFDLLIDDYGTDVASFALAVFIVLASMAHQKRTTEPPVPHATAMLVAGGVLGVLGVSFLLEEVRDGILGSGFLTVIGALVYYAGAIVAGVGALQLRK